MIAEYIRNLTRESIWVYGTSGHLLEFPPKPFRFSEFRRNGKLVKPPKEGVYYVVDSDVQSDLQEDWRYCGHIAKAKYSGSGKSGEHIYTLWDDSGHKLEIVSDNVQPEEYTFNDLEAKKIEGEIYLKYRRVPFKMTVFP